MKLSRISKKNTGKYYILLNIALFIDYLIYIVLLPLVLILISLHGIYETIIEFSSKNGPIRYTWREIWRWDWLLVGRFRNKIKDKKK